jgi:hypothetical protein
MQETPYTFLSPEQFSCVANRGVADAPLFLMNHWVKASFQIASTPRS